MCSLRPVHHAVQGFAPPPFGRRTIPLTRKGSHPNLCQRHFTFGSDMAEGVGFEPTSPFGEAVFKTAALNHSAIPP